MQIPQYGTFQPILFKFHSYSAIYLASDSHTLDSAAFKWDGEMKPNFHTEPYVLEYRHARVEIVYLHLIVLGWQPDNP